MESKELTKTEKKVADMSKSGMTVEEIALELGYCVSNIYHIKKKINRKTGVPCRENAKIDFTGCSEEDLNKLPDMQKKVAEMKMKGMSYAEISTEMKIPINRVYTFARNAKENISGTAKKQERKYEHPERNISKQSSNFRVFSTFAGKTFYIATTDTLEDAIKLRSMAEEKIADGTFIKWFTETYPERWQKLRNMGFGDDVAFKNINERKREYISTSKRETQKRSDGKEKKEKGKKYKKIWHLISPEGKHYYTINLRKWLHEEGKTLFKCNTEKDVSSIAGRCGQAKRKGGMYKGWFIEKQIVEQKNQETTSQ